MEKMYARKAFKCSICDKEYENAVDRAHCELTCHMEQERKIKEAEKAKKMAEQATRKAEVDKARETYIKLRDEYSKDYGAYVYIDEAVTNTLVNKWPSLGDVFDFLSM